MCEPPEPIQLVQVKMRGEKSHGVFDAVPEAVTEVAAAETLKVVGGLRVIAHTGRMLVVLLEDVLLDVVDDVVVEVSMKMLVVVVDVCAAWLTVCVVKSAVLLAF